MSELNAAATVDDDDDLIAADVAAEPRSTEPADAEATLALAVWVSEGSPPLLEALDAASLEPAAAERFRDDLSRLRSAHDAQHAFVCALHAGTHPADDSPVYRHDVLEGDVRSKVGQQAWLAMRLAVAVQRCEGGQSCTVPEFRLNESFPYSVSYDRRGARGIVRINTSLFARDASAAGVDDGTIEYASLLYGAISHEIGHWYADRGVHDAIPILRAKYPTLFQASDPPEWEREIFADWFAGQTIAVSRLPGTPLHDFFKAVGSSSPTHPPGDRRAAAVMQGFRDGLTTFAVRAAHEPLHTVLDSRGAR